MKRLLNLKNLSILLHAYIAVSALTIMVLGLCGAFFDGALSSSGLNFLKYFTSLSNIYAGLVSCYYVYYYIRHYKEEYIILPKYLKIIGLTAVVGLMLTFLVTLFFLAPTFIAQGYSFFFLYQGYLFCYHCFNPLVCLICYILVSRGPKLKLVESLYGVIPMATYSCFYTPFVLTGIWDDFYGFTFGGNYFLAPISLAVVLGVTFGISALSNLACNKIQKL